MNPKRKGNNEELKQAKQLSYWMFGDETVLERHQTSGAKKTAYSGDIIPIKQLAQYGWTKFNFMIEVKTGYEQFKPDFWRYTKVTEWFIKMRQDGQQTGQDIGLLICQFKNMPALLVTDQHFDGKILFNVSFPICSNGYVEFLYVFFLKDIFKYDFAELFDGIDYK